MTPTAGNPILANFVRLQREKRNWTQEHLAAVSGVSTRTVQRLERSGVHSAETLSAIAEAFDTDVQDVLEEVQRLSQKTTAEQADDLKKELDRFFLLQLTRCSSGKALFANSTSCEAQNFDYPEDLNASQADAVGRLLDYLRDFAEIASDLEPSDTIRAEQEINQKLRELAELGLSVFVGRYRASFALGSNQPVAWRVGVVAITATANPRIVRTGVDSEVLPTLIPRAQRPTL